ncbi:MAG TPA: hypothetical protein VEC17_00465 [Candidatus Binatia bacterium]|nr:hypothetical protein [Candidatus Binatia bacterium]
MLTVNRYTQNKIEALVTLVLVFLIYYVGLVGYSHVVGIPELSAFPLAIPMYLTTFGVVMIFGEWMDQSERFLGDLRDFIRVLLIIAVLVLPWVLAKIGVTGQIWSVPYAALPLITLLAYFAWFFFIRD